MRGLEAPDLLELLDLGHGRGPVERALLLLARAWPEGAPRRWEKLPLGHRDALLMALRAHTFGRQVTLATRCPGCETEIETGLDLGQVLAVHPGAEGKEEELTFEHAGRRVAFRLPASADLLTPASGEDLARRLVLSIDGEVPEDGEALPPDLAENLAAAVADADPLAEVRLELTCDECGEVTSHVFDVVPYFWSEIEAAGRRLVREVHLLASTYGWAEAEILALSSARRALYLEQVRP